MFYTSKKYNIYFFKTKTLIKLIKLKIDLLFIKQFELKIIILIKIIFFVNFRKILAIC